MGNSSKKPRDYSVINTYQGSSWTRQEDKGQYQIWNNYNSHRRSQAYPLNKKLSNNDLEKYEMRKNNEQDIVTVYNIAQQQNKNLCSKSNKAHVLVEHIPIRLSDIHDLTESQSLLILKSTFRGFNTLATFFGPIEPYEDMICFNQMGKTKVWLNSNLSLNHPEEQRQQNPIHDSNNSARNQVCVRKIFDMVENRTINHQLPYELKNKFRQANHSTFFEALNSVEEYIYDRNIALPDSININRINKHSEHLGSLPPSTNLNQWRQQSIVANYSPIQHPASPPPPAFIPNNRNYHSSQNLFRHPPEMTQQQNTGSHTIMNQRMNSPRKITTPLKQSFLANSRVMTQPNFNNMHFNNGLREQEFHREINHRDFHQQNARLEGNIQPSSPLRSYPQNFQINNRMVMKPGTVPVSMPQPQPASINTTMNRSIFINQSPPNPNFTINQKINRNIGFNKPGYQTHVTQINQSGQLNQLNQANLNRNFHSPSKVVYNEPIRINNFNVIPMQQKQVPGFQQRPQHNMNREEDKLQSLKRLHDHEESFSDNHQENSERGDNQEQISGGDQQEMNGQMQQSYKQKLIMLNSQKGVVQFKQQMNSQMQQSYKQKLIMLNSQKGIHQQQKYAENNQINKYNHLQQQKQPNNKYVVSHQQTHTNNQQKNYNQLYQSNHSNEYNRSQRYNQSSQEDAYHLQNNFNNGNQSQQSNNQPNQENEKYNQLYQQDSNQQDPLSQQDQYGQSNQFQASNNQIYQQQANQPYQQQANYNQFYQQEENYQQSNGAQKLMHRTSSKDYQSNNQRIEQTKNMMNESSQERNNILTSFGRDGGIFVTEKRPKQMQSSHKYQQQEVIESANQLSQEQQSKQKIEIHYQSNKSIEEPKQNDDNGYRRNQPETQPQNAQEYLESNVHISSEEINNQKSAKNTSREIDESHQQSSRFNQQSYQYSQNYQREDLDRIPENATTEQLEEYIKKKYENYIGASSSNVYTTSNYDFKDYTNYSFRPNPPLEHHSSSYISQRGYKDSSVPEFRTELKNVVSKEQIVQMNDDFDIRKMASYVESKYDQYRDDRRLSKGGGQSQRVSDMLDVKSMQRSLDKKYKSKTSKQYGLDQQKEEQEDFDVKKLEENLIRFEESRVGNTNKQNKFAVSEVEKVGPSDIRFNHERKSSIKRQIGLRQQNSYTYIMDNGKKKDDWSKGSQVSRNSNKKVSGYLDSIDQKFNKYVNNSYQQDYKPSKAYGNYENNKQIGGLGKKDFNTYNNYNSHNNSNTYNNSSRLNTGKFYEAEQTSDNKLSGMQRKNKGMTYNDLRNFLWQ